MSFLEETMSLLRDLRIFPNRGRGQNFMVNSSLLWRMTEHAMLAKSDTVLDVGAGFGFLTEYLAERCGCVLAVEYDPRLAGFLRRKFHSIPRVDVIEGDILKVHVPSFSKVASIPPYQISSRLLLWLFDREFNSAVLVLQREFADRLVAPVGSDSYGWLTVLTHCHFEVELFDAVPKESFYPEPKVDSVIVRVMPRRVVPFHLKNEEILICFVRSMFRERNRKVRNASVTFLKSVMKTQRDEALQLLRNTPFMDKRVRELTPEDFAVLADAFVQ